MRSEGVRFNAERSMRRSSFDDEFELRTDELLGDGMTACVYVAVSRNTGELMAAKLCDRRMARGCAAFGVYRTSPSALPTPMLLPASDRLLLFARSCSSLHATVCLPHGVARPRGCRSWDRLAQLMAHENALLQKVGDHPHLVTQRGYYESPWQCAIMLDLVTGGDCQQLLQRQGALPETLVRSFVADLHSALSHLHAMDVMHRDVKLENLLCNSTVRPPRIKLCDLGHAIIASRPPTRTDRVFYGTPGYAAPEVVQGPLWTFAADAWGMGVVMYSLLSNALPFEDGEYKRPVDFSARHWWRVSLEAKWLLQTLLERDHMQRGTIAAFEHSKWPSKALDAATNTSPPLVRHAHSMSNVNAMATSAAPASSMPHAASMTHIAVSVDSEPRSADVTRVGLMEGGPTEEALLIADAVGDVADKVDEPMTDAAAIALISEHTSPSLPLPEAPRPLITPFPPAIVATADREPLSMAKTATCDEPSLWWPSASQRASPHSITCSPMVPAPSNLQL